MLGIDLKEDERKRYEEVRAVVEEQTRLGVRKAAVACHVAFAFMYPPELRDKIIAQRPDAVVYNRHNRRPKKEVLERERFLKEYLGESVEAVRFLEHCRENPELYQHIHDSIDP